MEWTTCVSIHGVRLPLVSVWPTRWGSIWKWRCQCGELMPSPEMRHVMISSAVNSKLYLKNMGIILLSCCIVTEMSWRVTLIFWTNWPNTDVVMITAVYLVDLLLASMLRQNSFMCPIVPIKEVWLFTKVVRWLTGILMPDMVPDSLLSVMKRGSVVYILILVRFRLIQALWKHVTWNVIVIHWLLMEWRILPQTFSECRDNRPELNIKMWSRDSCAVRFHRDFSCWAWLTFLDKVMLR